MTHAIRFHQTGGPEVLRWEEVAVGDPGATEARIRQHACGLNFIDIYHRTGLYPVPLPSGMGLEGAGVVEAVGSAVRHLQPGDRVAYAGGPLGAYSRGAQHSRRPAGEAAAVHRFHERRGDDAAGADRAYLLRRTYRVQAGDTVLIHAAAGGVGLIACQWAKALGATVIGTTVLGGQGATCHAPTAAITSSSTRARISCSGCARSPAAKACAVVYDGVGKDTFTGSLDCLRPLGMMVTFGNASGPVPPLDLLLLSQKGSLFVTRPTLMHYVAKRADLEALAGELFEIVASSGKVRIAVNQTYALKDAAQAQIDLEARRTTGSTVLLP